MRQVLKTTTHLFNDVPGRGLALIASTHPSRSPSPPPPVFSAGPWSPFLGHTFTYRIPSQKRNGYRIFFMVFLPGYSFKASWYITKYNTLNLLKTSSFVTHWGQVRSLGSPWSRNEPAREARLGISHLLTPNSINSSRQRYIKCSSSCSLRPPIISVAVTQTALLAIRLKTQSLINSRHKALKGNQEPENRNNFSSEVLSLCDILTSSKSRWSNTGQEPDVPLFEGFCVTSCSKLEKIVNSLLPPVFKSHAH